MRVVYYSLKQVSDEAHYGIGKIMLEEKVDDYNNVGKLLAERIEQGIYPENYLEVNLNGFYDLQGEIVDKWLVENAEEFGFLYTKGDI